MTSQPAPQLSRVWQLVSPALAAEATAFWLRHGALDETKAQARSAELVAVAHDPSGALCAVSTASLRAVPQLGLRCFYARMFIAPRQRSPYLARELLAESVRTLASDARVSLPDGPKGLWLEIQNPKIQRSIRDLVWRVREFDFAYVGRSAQGHALRVHYFAGQRLPPPLLP